MGKGNYGWTTITGGTVLNSPEQTPAGFLGIPHSRLHVRQSYNVCFSCVSSLCWMRFYVPCACPTCKMAMHFKWGFMCHFCLLVNATLWLESSSHTSLIISVKAHTSFSMYTAFSALGTSLAAHFDWRHRAKPWKHARLCADWRDTLVQSPYLSTPCDIRIWFRSDK